MSTVGPPLIREQACSEEEIRAIAMSRLEKVGFIQEGGDLMKDGLVRVLARYCGILIERLNRVPESHHRAFLSMLGATPAPALPAHVALSFKAVSGATPNLRIVVPRFTQVSASADSDTVVFETVQDLPLVQAALVRAVAVDTRELAHSDVSSITSPASSADVEEPFFMVGAIPLKRSLHICQSQVIGTSNLTELKLKIALDQPGEIAPDISVEWFVESADASVLLPAISDTTVGLTRSGEITFAPPEKWPNQTIASMSARWLTCRLNQLRSPQTSTGRGNAHLIRITGIEISGFARPASAPIEAAYNGTIPLDVTRDFFPLGERPRFGDVFFALSESFTLSGAHISLDIKLTNPMGREDSPIPAVSNHGNPKLLWECSTRRGWVMVDCRDGTRALTQDGALQFALPDDVIPTAINGKQGGWIRVRLVGGSYISADRSTANEAYPPMAPPSIATMQMTSVKKLGPVEPESLVVESNFQFKKIDFAFPQSFNPFPLPEEGAFLLYLGLTIPGTKTSDVVTPNRGGFLTSLAGRTITLYFVPDAACKRVFSRDIRSDASAIPRWQARTAAGWRDCAIKDQTQGLNAPGTIDMHLPAEISEWYDSALDPQQKFLWLRVIWDSTRPGVCPCPRRLLLNTVLASQTVRLADEILGSSNGKPGQIFYALRLPVIGEVTLQVREPSANGHTETWPESEFQEKTHSFTDAGRPTNEKWTRWFCVEDFSLSDSHSRHFIIDRLTGRIQFGDGRNGRIPPPGANNVRLHEYRTGGGVRGNRPVGTITRLHTTIPYVESATNYEPAMGGQDTEGLESLSDGTAAGLRHRDRAVCINDYAELARKASPEVAYAKCIATRDLLDVPTERDLKPGVVSVTIVPRIADPCPRPSYNLVKVVKAFLDARRPVGVDLIVVGPEYVRVSVLAEIGCLPGHSTVGVVEECEKRLRDFLHPLTGGQGGGGWQFGERPHVSDIYSSFEAIEGLDHIRTLTLRSEEERPGLLLGETFLICSGKHEVRLC
ncbi:putative baseplate assembly protein [Nitrosospira sp. Is2]|uniref:putative baseplate assembly protein n=1 Tax=Nitrosospira sp. Is2 TaxID=3080532 RepID=UPI002955164E|nr:putative baseplate assembly protein [Nitrosospira sp. Is2]WON73518.1 putative baseplate assembly protein [Nitrosospira sp. Is2]